MLPKCTFFVDSSVLERADVVITSYQVVSSEHAAHLGGASSSAAQPKKKAAPSKAKKRVRYFALEIENFP
jgi:hypothetical protein